MIEKKMHSDISSCIFCKIIKNKAPAVRVYEDNETIAFMDKAPFNLGHTLVIPKKHYALLTDMNDEEVGRLFVVTRRIVKAVFEAICADGVNVTQSNGEAASQDIFHVHVHVVPRFKGDSKESFGFFPQRKRFSELEIEETASRIRRALTELI